MFYYNRRNYWCNKWTFYLFVYILYLKEHDAVISTNSLNRWTLGSIWSFLCEAIFESVFIFLEYCIILKCFQFVMIEVSHLLAVPFLIKQEFKIIFSSLTLKITLLSCVLCPPLDSPVRLIENKWRYARNLGRKY